MLRSRPDVPPAGGRCLAMWRNCCRRLIGMALAACAVAGCGIAPIADTLGERPLFRPLAVRVGATYTGQARVAKLVTPLARFDIGATSVARFEQAFAAMFDEVVPLPDWPPWRSAGGGPDGTLELERVEGELRFGNEADVPDFFSVRYRLCLYDRAALQLACWEPAASHSRQRRPFDCLDLGACLGLEVETAMRAAIAHFMVAFESDPAVRAWARPHADQVPAVAVAPDRVLRIGLLGWPLAGQSPAGGFVSEVETCLARGIARYAPELEVMSQRAVRDALFPLMEPGTQPPDEAAFAALLAREDVHARLAGHRVDYLVAFAGGTVADPWSGPMLCGAGFGAGGCLGFMWKSESTELQAALWSVEAARAVRRAAASAAGVGLMPAFVLPVPLPARTGAEACDALARHIVAAVREAQKR